MKKILTVLFSLAVAFVGNAKNWTDPATGIAWTYDDNGDGAAILGCGVSTGAIEIPSVIAGLSVTSIGECAFDGCSG